MLGMSLAQVFSKHVDSAIRNAISYLMGKIIYRVDISSGNNPLYTAMNSWYRRHYGARMRINKAKLNTDYYNGIPEYTLIISPLVSMGIIRHKEARMFLKKTTDWIFNGDKEEEQHKYQIYGKSQDVEAFLKYLEGYWNSTGHEDGLCVIYDTGYKSEHFYKRIYKTFDDLFFDGKEELIEHIDVYLQSEDQHFERKIKYKTGILLGGKPGTGKTEAAFAIAAYTQRTIYYLSPRSFAGDAEFQEFMMSIRPGSVVLMEDVDDFFGNREDNTASKTAVSFSSVLNSIDGLFSPHDVIIVMTTNKPETLDSALVRKGRLDYKMTFDYPVGKYVNQFVNHYFGTTGVHLSPNKRVNYPMVDVEAICKDSKDVQEAIRKLVKHGSEHGKKGQSSPKRKNNSK